MKQKIKILYVEDEENWHLTVIPCLEERFAVTAFKDINKAKAAFRREKFDIVICDGTINASNDGYNWAWDLNKNQQKVILLSSIPSVEIPSVPKGPFNPVELERMIDKLLGTDTPRH